MTETYCTKTDVQLKAGGNAATLTDAQYTSLINEAESYVNHQIENNYLTKYAATLDANLKLLLSQATSCHAALSAIAYNQTGFFPGEVTNLLNVNANLRDDAIKLIKANVKAMESGF